MSERCNRIKKIVLKGFIVVPEEDLTSINDALPDHIENSNKEEGCIAFMVTQRKSEPNVFDVYEEFTSQQAFDNHQNRVKSSAWGRISARAKRYYQIEKV